MKKTHYALALTAALCAMLTMSCSKKTEPSNTVNESPNDAALANAGNVQDTAGGNQFMPPPPFGSGSYKRDIVEICDDGQDNDNDGKADCDDAKCVGHVACIAKTAPVIDESKCIAIDLANPNSTDLDVLVNDAKKALTINIKDKVCIKLSGAYDGRVALENHQNVDVDLILDNVSITSKDSSGTLKLNTAKKNKGNHFVVKLVGDNKIEGAGNKDSKNVLACDANLDIIGDGSLKIVNRYKTGLAVDDVLHVWSGKIDIEVARDNKDENLVEKGFGMKIENGFIQSGGEIVITARDNVYKYESRGIKVDGKESEYGAGKGYVIVTGGSLTIESDAKALSAGWSLADDSKTETTDDDPYPDVTITGGKVSLHTYVEPRESRPMGMPPGFGDMKPKHFENVDKDKLPPEIVAAIDAQKEHDELNAGKEEEFKLVKDEEEDISVSPEGLEAKGHMFLKGGEITVVATDDGINAGGQLIISGGTIYARSTDNDALDSNDKIHVAGGTTVVLGSSEPEGGFDADFSSNVSYEGGNVIAIGGENNSPGTVMGSSSFVQMDLVEKAMRGGPGMPPPPGMDGQGGMMPPPPEMDGRGPGMGGHGPGGRGRGMGGPGGRPGKQKKLSELAGKTIAITAKDSKQAIAAIKLPADYMGGGNLLIMNDKIAKDADYQIYPDATLSGDLKWYHDTMLMSEATVEGSEPKDIKGGTATKGMFEHGGGPGGPRMGGHRGPGMGHPGQNPGMPANEPAPAPKAEG